MKKLILTLIITFFCLIANAQNLIGSSAKDVYKTLNQKGYILNQGYTTEQIYYIMGSDDESIRIYYFTTNNICFMYALSYAEFNYLDIVSSLKRAGYVQLEDGNFYTQTYKASIVYFKEYGCYFVIITLRNE